MFVPATIFFHSSCKGIKVPRWVTVWCDTCEGRRSCECVHREEWVEVGRCSWINDVLEQVHKWEGLMFVSKDNVVLICEVWPWLENPGYPLSFCLHGAHTHTRKTSTTWALHMCLVSPSGFININLKRLVSSVQLWVQVLRRWLQALININELWNGDWLTPPLTGLHHTWLPLMFIHYLERENKGTERETKSEEKKLRLREWGEHGGAQRFTAGLRPKVSDRWTKLGSLPGWAPSPPCLLKCSCGEVIIESPRAGNSRR